MIQKSASSAFLILFTLLMVSACTINIKSEDGKPSSSTTNEAEAIPLTPAAELDTDLTELAGSVKQKKNYLFESDLDPSKFGSDDNLTQNESALNSNFGFQLHSFNHKHQSHSIETEVSEENNDSNQNQGFKKFLMNRSPASKNAANAKIVHYTVKNYDTLMKISFEFLGNVTRWREIYADNQSKIPNPSSLTPGTQLEIRVFDAVHVKKNGSPYDIKRGDTLGKISNWIYGSFSKWKLIWNNNRELIHHPNLIYAGFRLYFIPPANGRRVASSPINNPPSPQTSTPAYRPSPLIPIEGAPIAIPDQQKVEAK